MIVATPDQIASTIAGNAELLRTVHGFLQAALGDVDDLDALLGELAQRIAACGPFKDEVDMIATVKSETLQALRALTLRRMPAMGRA
jgi:hypothetical protein